MAEFDQILGGGLETMSVTEVEGDDLEWNERAKSDKSCASTCRCMANFGQGKRSCAIRYHFITYDSATTMEQQGDNRMWFR